MNAKAGQRAALATGNETKVRTIIEIARATNPDDAAELDTILAGFEAKLAEAKAAEAAARTARLRSARFFENWRARASSGAFAQPAIRPIPA